ncbi:MAG: hypothetical protein RLZZ207_733 [Bacteroidota bacterium]
MSADMKYKLSSNEFTAILFEVQETKTEEHSSAEAEIKASFFMGEVDLCWVIRIDQAEVVLFGLYLYFLLIKINTFLSIQQVNE